MPEIQPSDEFLALEKAAFENMRKAFEAYKKGLELSMWQRFKQWCAGKWA